MYNSFSSVYAITGQKIKVECPPKFETTLLFANRYRFSDKSLADIFIQSDQPNSKKEKLLTFNNDEKDTSTINLIIKPNTVAYFSFQGQDCGIRLLFATKSSQSIQCTIPLVHTLESSQIENFSKKILVELEKAFKSDESLLIMLLIFEKYFSNNFFLQKEEEFPIIIQNIFQTSIKRLKDNLIDDLYKLINFVSFKLSLGYNLTEAAAIILITIVKTILSNESSANTINEIINQFYDTPNFLIFQSLIINIKPSIINQSLLLPVTFCTNKNIDAILSIYNYVACNKAKIHFTYLNLFSLVASEEELKLLFDQNQLYDPEEYILKNKNINNNYHFIHTQISKSSIFEVKEKKEIKNTINFKPKKINQPPLQRSIEQPKEQKSNEQQPKEQQQKEQQPANQNLKSYKPKLNVSTSYITNFPFKEKSLTISKYIPCSIHPSNNQNLKSKQNKPVIQQPNESNQSKQQNKKEDPKNRQVNQKKQGRNTRQSKQKRTVTIVSDTKSSTQNEETKKSIKSKPSRKSLRKIILLIIFANIVVIAIFLLLSQYFFI